EGSAGVSLPPGRAPLRGPGGAGAPFSPPPPAPPADEYHVRVRSGGDLAGSTQDLPPESVRLKEAVSQRSSPQHGDPTPTDQSDLRGATCRVVSPASPWIISTTCRT